MRRVVVVVVVVAEYIRRTCPPVFFSFFLSPFVCTYMYCMYVHTLPSLQRSPAYPSVPQRTPAYVQRSQAYPSPAPVLPCKLPLLSTPYTIRSFTYYTSLVLSIGVGIGHWALGVGIGGWRLGIGVYVDSFIRLYCKYILRIWTIE